MASKKDLVEAQAFSRRRLLTAFVAGAPGGRELEPTKPMRAVVSGLVLAVLVVVGSLAVGLFKTGLKDGWDESSFVITKGEGARFVAQKGTLYPVLNLASARLILGADMTTYEVSDEDIEDSPRGATVGIPGAPDMIAKPEKLVNDGWVSCVSSDGFVSVILEAEAVKVIGADVAAQSKKGAETPGQLVQEASGGQQYLIADGRSYVIPEETRNAVLAALDMSDVQPLEVPAKWLDLFTVGEPLKPLEIDDKGNALPGSIPNHNEAVVGSLLHVADPPSGSEYYIAAADEEGVKVDPLTAVAYAMYMAGAGGGVDDQAIDVSFADVRDIARLPESLRAAPVDWPAAMPTIIDDDMTSCAYLSTEETKDGEETPTHLVGSAEVIVPEEDNLRSVDPSGGALVVPVAVGANEKYNKGELSGVGDVQLIDARGTAYSLTDVPELGSIDGIDTALGVFGYSTDDLAYVPQTWLRLFASGPALSSEAAKMPYVVEQPTAPDGDAAAAEGGGTFAGASADAVVSTEGDTCSADSPTWISDRPAALLTLGAEQAWRVSRGDRVLVAVVDSGVAATNAHFAGIQVVREGVDLVTGQSAQTDEFGHGTIIAAIIAGRAVEGSGVEGLAPAAQILPVRVYVSDTDEAREAGLDMQNRLIAEGIRYAADFGAQIINVSLSSSADPDLVLKDAVEYATANGSLVVASAGNRATAEDKTDGPRYPAAYEQALSVTAVDNADQPVPTDAIQGWHIRVAAPGQEVISAFVGGRDCIYGGEVSTSYATAYVSAAAALIASAYPEETPAQWAYRLMVTAKRPVADQRDDAIGWGVIRPWAALTFVDDGTAPGPSSPTFPDSPDTTVAAEPIEVHPVTDPLAASQAASLWWVLGGGAALVGTVLLSMPSGRHRRTTARRGGPEASAVAAGG